MERNAKAHIVPAFLASLPIHLVHMLTKKICKGDEKACISCDLHLHVDTANGNVNARKTM